MDTLFYQSSQNLATPCIVARIRESNQIYFLEFLLVFDTSKNMLSLPIVLPERYANRISNNFKLDNVNIYVVKSCYDNEILSIDLQLLKKNNGIWVIKNDFEKKGGFGDLMNGIAQFMSVPIDDFSLLLINKTYSCLFEHFKKFYTTFINPISLYHGTSLENIKNIKEHGLQVSKDGMLGSAIYFGTFWKACRFSSKTQDYKDIDNGCIIRTIVLTEFIQIVPRNNWKCECKKCFELGTNAWGVDICDHDSKWKKTHDGIHAQVIPNLCIQQKCALRNEEWAVKETVGLILTHFAQIDNSTLPKPHYDPFWRKTKIL
jgi:hypothetical protein